MMVNVQDDESEVKAEFPILGRGDQEIPFWIFELKRIGG
jgi:hypothetical protein